MSMDESASRYCQIADGLVELLFVLLKPNVFRSRPAIPFLV